MFQAKGKGGSSRSSSKGSDTRTFVPETVRVGGLGRREPVPVQARPTPQPQMPVHGPDRAPSARQSTQPFVPETVRISGMAMPVGTAPSLRPSSVASHAKGRASTALPKPSTGASEAGKKRGRDSSLLGLLVPSLAKRSKLGPVPPKGQRPDATLEVSENDLSLVESCTQELDVCDLSGLADMPRAPVITGEHDDPPPLPGLGRRRQSPWLVWSMVGGAWCVMIALALLAVDDDGAQKAETSPRIEAPLVGAAAALQNSAETAPKLEVSAPAALPLNDANRAAESAHMPADAEAVAPGSARSPEGELRPAARIEPSESASDEHPKREKRVHKRSKERREKLAAAKKKRMKHKRAHKRERS